MSDYDPVECLREEVKRFKASNTFTPMLVTGFYLQASCVLDELDRLRKHVAMLTEYKAMAIQREQALRVQLNAKRISR